MPGDEYRKLKGLYKKILAKEKEENLRAKMLSREINEAKHKTGYE